MSYKTFGHFSDFYRTPGGPGATVRWPDRTKLKKGGDLLVTLISEISATQPRFEANQFHLYVDLLL